MYIITDIFFYYSQGPPGPAGLPGFGKDGSMCSCQKGEKGDRGEPVTHFYLIRNM